MTDAELVARVLDGHVEEFAALVDRYHGGCRRFARHLLGDADDADDATQETFLRAYTGLGRYDERNRFRAWLYRILVNQCRSLARQRRRRNHRFVQDPALVDQAPAKPSGLGSWERRSLDEVLALLEPRAREALLLKYGEGLEYGEMAVITGVGISALKMRVKRAVEVVRPRLEELLRG